MILLGVEFVGGDFNSAAKGIIADIFSDPEFMAPGWVPLWGARGLVGDNEDCTGFSCMPRRPFYWLINKHGVHTFSNDPLGLNERDEYLTFMTYVVCNRLRFFFLGSNILRNSFVDQ